MVHTAVVLPRDLLEQLRGDAKASDRGLSTEIRHRLQLTYDQEGLPRDAKMADLVETIKWLADNLARALGMKWHEHPYAMAAFKAGVVELLTKYEPKGDENTRADAPVGERDPPEVVGRTHARFVAVVPPPVSRRK